MSTMKTISHARGFIQRLGLQLAGIDPSHFVLSMPMTGNKRTIKLTIGGGEFSIATDVPGGAGGRHNGTMSSGGNGLGLIKYTDPGSVSVREVHDIGSVSSMGVIAPFQCSEGGRSGRDQIGPFLGGTGGGSAQT